MSFCRETREIKRILSIASITVAAVGQLSAAEATFETVGFVPVSGGEIIGDSFSFYISTFDDVAYSNNNAREYIVFDSLITLRYNEYDEDIDEDDTMLLLGGYHGYNTATESEQDEGRILMECSANDDENYIASSGVVGFIRKSGPWEKTGEEIENLVANATGSIHYTTLEKSRDVDVVFNGTYQGTPYNLYDTTTLSVSTEDAVSLSRITADNDSSYEFVFSGMYFTRIEDLGNVYESFLKRSDSEDPDDWWHRYATIRVTDNNDADGDGIPNFSDLGAENVYGVLTTNSIELSEDKIWSEDLHTTVLYDSKELWLYGENLGWFYMPDQDDASQIRIYIPDERLGWLWTNADLSPVYVRESDGTKLYFARVDEEIRYWDYTLEKWCDLVY